MSPKTREPEERREAILKAAFQLFSKQGIEKTKLDDVARLARVSKGSLYHIAEDKYDLVYLVFENIVKAEIERARKALLQYEKPVEWIRAVVNAILPTVREDPGNYAFRVEFLAIALRNPKIGEKVDQFMTAYIGDLQGKIMDKVQRDIDTGYIRPDIDFEVITNLMHGWIHHIWNEWIINPQLTREYIQDLSERFIDFLIEAITVKKPG